MGEYDRITYLSWLASAQLPSVLFKNLFSYDDDPVSLFERFFVHPGNEEFTSLLPQKARALLTENGKPQKMDWWNEKNQQHNVKAITVFDREYPSGLMNITDPPNILFYQGDLSALKHRCISMIGSRRASYAGVTATQKIARELSLHGICVISGLAYGIDKASHEGCLKGSTPTVAIVGNGLDIDYPTENTELKQKIITAGGAVLSEYPIGEQPLGWHFPVRNRIISALGNALIVMEAAIKSGSMTTVQHALDQGKDVFVYPGDPTSRYYAGNHQLIREGAIYFTEAADILEDMGWLDNTGDVMQNSDCPLKTLHLSDVQKKICERLQQGELSFDQICNGIAVPPGELSGILTILQINGIIEAIPGKRYRIRND